ncbi:MAG: hypothetical protein F4Y01_13175 [Gammaproteobacteria bacterium]|nr:hypothetical protein [Gammaproteobacteria bacterium]
MYLGHRASLRALAGASAVRCANCWPAP